MRSDLTHQLWHRLGARELDLLDGAGRALKELAGLALQRVQSVEAEEVVEDLLRGCGEAGLERRGSEGAVEVLHNHVLCVRGGETVEVYEEAVPGLLLFVTVL